MEGITIVETVMKWHPLIITMLFSGLAVVGCFTATGVCESHGSPGAWVFGTLSLLGLIVFLIALGISIRTNMNPEETHIMAMINDNVPFTEVYEHYEVIDRHGLIYELVALEEE